MRASGQVADGDASGCGWCGWTAQTTPEPDDENDKACHEDANDVSDPLLVGTGLESGRVL